MNNWESIIPFLIIIPIAIWTKQVLPGLTLGLLAASYLVEPSLLGGIEKMTSYIIGSLAKEPKLQIIGFLYVFTGLVNMINMTGGIRGFIELTSEKIKTKKQAIFLIWITLLGTFISPSLRIVTIAPIMKQLQRKLDITKERVSFVIEASSLPVIALVPIATAFIGYMTSTIDVSLNDSEDINAYAYFIKSIPFNFFSLIAIALALIYSIFQHPKMFGGGENNREKESVDHKTKNADTQEKTITDTDVDSKPMHLFIPLTLALVLSIFLSWWDGYQKTANVLQAFIEADVSKYMLIAIIITLFLAFVQFLIAKYPLQELVKAFFDGGNKLMPAFFLFALVWGLTLATNDLGLPNFITNTLGFIPSLFIPPITFIIGSILAYFIGSSWGSWGLLMPIGVSLAESSDISLSLMIGIIFACGTLGGLISPLSNTTVTIAKIMEMEIMEYSVYKIKHTIVPFVLSIALYLVYALVF
ncbi:Na+/H+ antiporter NhaC family protein [Terrihalobacillus insolitus]|uniref:Na+/H+ antiporter NhaC family protein n=1 Tax=Terrihalobacillus insolitus TaxID=2950438 RepID=UPI002342716E|nr:Na+/H+ antiporter NhaC family protein [Terrihalobacillus insolitus]MDC3413202.1 sodium:proton antiporter [Terrihalobacillus insolitus]